MEKLIGLVSALHPDVSITPKTRLIDDGILDSLDIVTLVTDINDAYGINIGAEEIIPENFTSVNDIVPLIQRLGGDVCR